MTGRRLARRPPLCTGARDSTATARRPARASARSENMAPRRRGIQPPSGACPSRRTPGRDRRRSCRPSASSPSAMHTRRAIAWRPTARRPTDPAARSRATSADPAVPAPGSRTSPRSSRCSEPQAPTSRAAQRNACTCTMHNADVPKCILHRAFVIVHFAPCLLRRAFCILHFTYRLPPPSFSVVYRLMGTSAHSSARPSGHRTRTRGGFVVWPRPASTRGSLADA